MSADQWILRIARPLADDDGSAPEIVPFPAGAEVERRLRGVTGVKRTRRRELYLDAPSGRIPLSIESDRIVAEGAAPTDLLPLLTALADLGPLVVYDPQTEAWHDPSKLQAAPGPQPDKPIYGPPIQLPPGDGFLQMKWAAPRIRGDFPGLRVCRDGHLYVDTQDRHLRTSLSSIDVHTGRTLWTMFVGRGIPQCALLGDFMIGISLPNVYGLDCATGEVRWRVKLSGGPDVHFPGAVIDTERGTITVRSGWTAKYFDENVIDARGNLVSRVRRARSELTPPPPPVRPPEVMLAPGRPLERCLIVDERRAIHFMGAYDMVPRPEHMITRELRNAYESAIFERWNQMRFVLFDRETGDAIEEQVVFSPPDFFRATPWGPTFHVAGDMICLLHGAGAYGAVLRLPR